MREVILLPGWGCDLHCWMPVLRTGTISTFIPWQDCLGDTPEDNALLRRINRRTDPVAIVGWSLGALIALGAAQRYPDAIANMLLLSATAQFCRDGEYPGAEVRALRAMILKLQRDPEQVLQDFATLSAQPDAGEDYITAFKRQAEGLDAETLVAGLQYFEKADFREGLAAITAPVQLLHGADDAIVPLASAQWLADALPNAALEVLPGMGHALPYTATSEVIEYMKQSMNG